MKLVISSDWHLDAVTAGVPREHEIRIAAEQVVNAAVAHADAFLFLGDLCDPDASRGPRCAAFAIECVRKIGCRQYWLTGNHDVIEDGSGTSVLEPLAAMGGDALVNEPRVVMVDDLAIVALPYVPRALAYDPAEFVRAAAAQVAGARWVLVAGHLTLPGMHPGSESEEFARGRVGPMPLDVVREVLPNAVLVNGHYHRATVHENVNVPGALARLTFGECDHEPSFLTIDFDKRGPRLKWERIETLTRLQTFGPEHRVWEDGVTELPGNTLVKLVPPTDATEERVANVYDALRSMSAGVALMAAAPSGSALAASAAASVAERGARKTHRQVVYDLIAETNGIDHDELSGLADEIMNAEGL